MNEPPFIFSIVPAQNARGHLDRCLNALLASSDASFGIIVVDDGSTDETAETARAKDVIAVARTRKTRPGAVRKKVFEKAGGFDHTRYARPSLEDIELGFGLMAMGCRILLDRALQVKHWKRWTLESLLRADILRRASPSRCSCWKRVKSSTTSICSCGARQAGASSACSPSASGWPSFGGSSCAVRSCSP